MFSNQPNYNCRVTLDDGRYYHVYADWLKNNDMHHWLGWHCEAGITRIYVDKNLEVWSGECKNDKLGKFGEEWNMLEKNNTCRRKTCSSCTDDLLTTKWQP